MVALLDPDSARERAGKQVMTLWIAKFTGDDRGIEGILIDLKF